MKIAILVTIIALLMNSSLFEKSTQEITIEEIPEEKIEEITQQLQKPQGSIEENKTHINIHFQEQDKSVEIIKDKIGKTAQTTMIITIPEELESEETSTVPLTVNFVCTLFAATFFDPEEFEKYQESLDLDIKYEESIFKGSEMTKVEINFIDQNNGLIADCTITGSDPEDIEFNAYKSYENSMFNMQIGDIGASSSLLFKTFFKLIPKE